MEIFDNQWRTKADILKQGVDGSLYHRHYHLEFATCPPHHQKLHRALEEGLEIAALPHLGGDSNVYQSLDTAQMDHYLH